MATHRALKVLMRHVWHVIRAKKTHMLITSYVPGVRIPGGSKATFRQAFELLEKPSSLNILTEMAFKKYMKSTTM